MEGREGGVGSGGLVLNVPDLLRRTDEDGEGLEVGTGGGIPIDKGSGTGVFTGGVGSFRGERGCGDALELRSLPGVVITVADGVLTYCAGVCISDKDMVANTISCKSE